MDKECPICMDEMKEPIEIKICHHIFCETCIIEHCRCCIEQRMLPIPCPRALGSSEDKCYGSIDSDMVENVLEPTPHSVWKKRFLRFSVLNEHPNWVDCPGCQEVVPPSSDSNESQVTCSHCQMRFCKIHGDVHLGKSCETYLSSREAGQISISESLVRVWTKSCSHCGSRIQKSGGCDHVVCPACQQDMCYRCGTHLHLQGKTIRTCSKCNQGFVDHRRLCFYRLSLLWIVPLHLILSLVWAGIGILIFLISFCFFGFFLGGSEVTDDGSIDFQLGIRRSLELIFYPFLLFLDNFMAVPVPWVNRAAHPPVVSPQDIPEIPSF